jgi:hypothetical protein
MPGQVIGTVNVQIGPTINPRVNTLTYGGRTLKSATDLDLANKTNGDVIVYQANTNSFIVSPVNSLVPSLDQGFF